MELACERAGLFFLLSPHPLKLEYYSSLWPVDGNIEKKVGALPYVKSENLALVVEPF